MTTISLSREKVISTVDFIVEQYEKAQVSRWEEIRLVISPSVGEYCHWRDCFLRDWERVRSKLQGILLLLSDLSDSDDLIKYLKCSKEKVTDLWSQCGVDLTSLQHPEYKVSIAGGNQVRALVSDSLGQGGITNRSVFVHESEYSFNDEYNQQKQGGNHE
ncbi:MAG: hypothetical protein M0R47_01380 [Methylobacter sp.]|uniref:hypothetical protein n=1 Tax=Methylobacter sp. TaxID=2051955 RepID=UPI0025F3ABC0|nr:hypothetical protein [Methylobacter sp.]MCK9619167.1 hypothetical protein [Methylobacter sp.]